MSLLDELPHRCTINERTRRKSSSGFGAVEVRTARYTDVECWEQQASASDIQEFARRSQVITKVVYFTTDYSIKENDEIVITKRNGVAVPAASQVTLEVTSTQRPDASSGFGILYKITVNENTGSVP